MFSSREIRKKFLEFFLAKQHSEIRSSSLIPAADDPTVLFTTAGMQQFVPYLMGEAHPQGKRLCSVQKCVRTVDIDEVGDNRHLTFFEMLGNWSLGDYFKKEAIAWSYEFLTEHLNIPKEKIWVTVFAGDQDVPLDTESMAIWESLGIPKERILPVGPKKGSKKNRGDNFWGPAGKSGPCGPSTEIYVDTLATKLKKGENPVTNDERFLEVWNDVFMEYFQDEHGKLTKLAQKNVDTGMGLERMAMILHKTPTVFETDAFAAIFTTIQKITGEKYPPFSGDNDSQNPVTRAMRVIADHVRSATHIIADGGMPSNEGRGYVLRRLIRRAARFGRKLNLEQPFLTEIAQVYLRAAREFHPELAEREQLILQALKTEEEKFLETLERGEKLLSEMLASAGKKLTGAAAFQLFDTYGFPFDLTKEIAAEQKVQVDEAGFHAAMAEQKARSRGAKGDFFERSSTRDTFANLPKTIFLGYEQDHASAKILALEYAERGQEGSHLMVEVVLDQTPFYAESGGQVGDTGLLSGENGMIKVLTTKKLPNGVFIHNGEVIQGEIRVGEKVEAKIDAERREQIRRHHSLTHLLHAALKKVLGAHAAQQGSLVTPQLARFDFSHPKAVSADELRQIEFTIAAWVQHASPVEVTEMELAAAKAAGAEALFSEKYDRTVRTIRMGKVSFELCGGTHVRNTADIGAVQILSEGSVASGVRRIEIVCAEAAQKLLWQESDTLRDIAERLKVPVESIAERLKALFAEKKELEEKLQTIQKELIRFEAVDFLDMATEISGMKIICEPVPTGDVQKLGLLVRELTAEGIELALLFTHDGSVAVSSRGKLSAKEVLQKVLEFAGGSGGGGQNFAQGAKINLEEFRTIRELIQKFVKRTS